MLTKVILRNFKRFQQAEVELGKSVVLIGPNNSGKTTALQALALWNVGLKAWGAKRGNSHHEAEDRHAPSKRPGVAINRRDLTSIPVPSAKLLWRGLHVRDTEMMPVQDANGNEHRKQATKNIRIEVAVEGISDGVRWECGLEFDYANEESFLCRPLRLPGFDAVQVSKAEFSSIPPQAHDVSIAYLPPMSGLTDREFIKERGEIGFWIGQGQTAQVLRNLCYQVFSQEGQTSWEKIVTHIRELFGVSLQAPVYTPENSEITMQYKEGEAKLDLSCGGRGLQQTLLLLAHLYANPKTVLLIDEPDAHLEILRQRQVYQLLTEVADANGSQIVAASHSEIVLNEAAGCGKVIAFVGRPHTMNDQGSQLLKALSDIGWEQYYQAETRGWLVCLEGATDLAILRAFAKTLDHPAQQALSSPFVHYVSTNLPEKARSLFYGLREAKPDLRGIAIFDRIEKKLQGTEDYRELMWSRRELENYFCSEEILMRYARNWTSHTLFGPSHERAMQKAIERVSELLEVDEKTPWSPDVKATDEVLDRIFRLFFKELDLPLIFRKSDYYELAGYLEPHEIDPEIADKLNAICEIAQVSTE